MPRQKHVVIPDRESDLRILIIRLSAIGDVLMTSPVAEALHEAFPHAHISWIVEPLSAPLVRANPDVDEIIVLEQKDQWLRLLTEWKIGTLLREFRTFRRELRARQFDIAIDFQGLLKSAVLAWLSGAPRRIGTSIHREGSQLLMTEIAERPRHTTRLTQGYLNMLTAMGIPLLPRRPRLTVPPEDRAIAQEFLAARGLAASPYAAVCAASSRPQKDWVWSRWGELADLLWEREGLRTVIIGGPERRADSLSLVESCASRPISAVGHMTLLQSAALVQDAALVVGGDTGLTYAGLATDTPTVALYGSTDPSWLTEEPFASICFHPMPCSPCRRRPTCKGYDCMQAISVEEVADAATALLQHCRVLTSY